MTGLLTYTFFTNALAGVLLIAISSAMVGTYVMARRMVAISGGITHACFGGLGLGYFLGISPIATAAVFAVGSSAAVEWMSRRHRIRTDSAIAVVWSIGMALGVLFVFMTPGYVPALNGFLFGNILNITRADLTAFAVMTAALILFFAIFRHSIVACAFDSDFAAVRGLHVRFITYTMTVFTAICIVLTIRLVGVMLLMSALTLPQMAAEVCDRRFTGIMFRSVAISVLCGVAGLTVSAYVDVPCSALIVMAMAAAYIIMRLIKALSVRTAAS